MITPPDVISQIIIGNVFIVFYEIAIVINILQNLFKKYD
jgi:Sec-independent protein secretion pathway component TatC